MDVPILKITNPVEGLGPEDENLYGKKPIVMVIGRQHSGETHSSFIIHGLINFLVSKDTTAFKLRSELEFWILPVVNPDGVIIGNYRCNL
jgi:murein tripeptide amidase MpaA